MKKLLLLSFIILITAMFVITACSGSKSKSKTDTGASDPIDINQLPGEITPREATFCPTMGKRFFEPKKFAELVLLNNNGSGGISVVDPLSSTTLFTGSDANLASSRSKVSVKGQLDNDYYEEIVYVTWTSTDSAVLGILNPSAANAIALDSPSVNLSPENGASNLNYSVALGDIDGDKRQEIVIGGAGDGLTSGKVWIIDDAANGYTLLKTITIDEYTESSVTYGINTIKVAVGNLNGGIEQEIAVLFSSVPTDHSVETAGNAAYKMFYGKSGDYSEIAGGELPSFYTSYADYLVLTNTVFSYHFYSQVLTAVSMDIIMKDMNHDGKDEVMAGAVGDSYDASNGLSLHPVLEVLRLNKDNTITDYTVNAPDRSTVGINPYFTGYAEGNDYFIGMLSRRIPESLPMQISYNSDDSRNELNFGPLTYYYSLGEFTGEKNIELNNLDRFLDSRYLDDADGDNVKDMISVQFSVTNLVEQSDRTLVVTSGSDASTIYTASVSSGCIAVPANVDDDSTILEYTGDSSSNDPDYMPHTTTYKNNHIVAILSAPPAEDGIGQNLDGSYTTFGTSSGQSFTSGAEVSVRAGVCLGQQVEAQAGFLAAMTTVASAEWNVTVETEASASIATEQSVTKSISTQTAWDEDMVIFSAVPYDQYCYKILCNPDNTSLVNTYITWEVPQTPLLFAFTKEFYNDHNGDQLEVNENMLLHTPGNIRSYLTASERDELLDQTSVTTSLGDFSAEFSKFGKYGPVAVDQGSGSREVSIELSDTVTASGSVTLSSDFEANACVATVCGGFNTGVSLGVFFESTWSTSTTFAGSVGAIDAANYIDYYYQYGMFVYKQKLLDSGGNTLQDFFVINYWVE